MILIIQNATPGLLDNRTKQTVPTDRHVPVVDSPYWRQRIRQSPVELVRELADARALAEWKARNADHFKRKRADTQDDKPKATRKRKRKPAPTAEVPPPKPEPEPEKE